MGHTSGGSSRDPAYFINQTCMLFLLSVVLLLYCLQIAVEYRRHWIQDMYLKAANTGMRISRLSRKHRARQVVGDVQYWMHRLGLVPSFLMVLLFVDPYGFDHIWPDGLSRFLSFYATAFMYAAGMQYTYLMTAVCFKILRTRMSPVYHRMFNAVIALTFVVATIAGALPFLDDSSFWITGAYLVWLAFAELFVLVMYDVGAWRLFKVHKKFAANLRKASRASPRPGSRATELTGSAATSRTNLVDVPPPLPPTDNDNDDNHTNNSSGALSPSLSKGGKSPVIRTYSGIARSSKSATQKAMNWLTTFGIAMHILLLLAIVMQLATAANTVSESARVTNQQKFHPYDKNDYRVTESFLAWLQAACLMLGLWASWLPLSELWAPIDPFKGRPLPSPSKARKSMDANNVRRKLTRAKSLALAGVILRIENQSTSKSHARTPSASNVSNGSNGSADARPDTNSAADLSGDDHVDDAV